jgi:integrase
MGAAAVRFLILTAARSGEVRFCRWDEIDLVAGLWSLPASKTKAGRVHRVPLAPAVLELLAGVAALRHSALVFPGRQPRGVLNDMTLTGALRRAGYDNCSVHGMRSSFRDWAADTGQPADLAEMALAHSVGNAVERAYRRSDVIERRRALMDAWATFLTMPPAAVIPFKAA